MTATRHKPMSVDQKSYDLAEHFMADVKGHTAAHVRELAEAIQTACEDHCSMAEADTSKSDAEREMTLGRIETPEPIKFRPPIWLWMIAVPLVGCVLISILRWAAGAGPFAF